jgi:hypothetical protein
VLLLLRHSDDPFSTALSFSLTENTHKITINANYLRSDRECTQITRITELISVAALILQSPSSGTIMQNRRDILRGTNCQNCQKKHVNGRKHETCSREPKTCYPHTTTQLLQTATTLSSSDSTQRTARCKFTVTTPCAQPTNLSAATRAADPVQLTGLGLLTSH